MSLFNLLLLRAAGGCYFSCRSNVGLVWGEGSSAAFREKLKYIEHSLSFSRRSSESPDSRLSIS